MERFNTYEDGKEYFHKLFLENRLDKIELNDLLEAYTYAVSALAAHTSINLDRDTIFWDNIRIVSKQGIDLLGYNLETVVQEFNSITEAALECSALFDDQAIMEGFIEGIREMSYDELESNLLVAKELNNAQGVELISEEIFTRDKLALADAEDLIDKAKELSEKEISLSALGKVWFEMINFVSNHKNLCSEDLVFKYTSLLLFEKYFKSAGLVIFKTARMSAFENASVVRKRFEGADFKTLNNKELANFMYLSKVTLENSFLKTEDKTFWIKYNAEAYNILTDERGFNWVITYNKEAMEIAEKIVSKRIKNALARCNTKYLSEMLEKASKFQDLDYLIEWIEDAMVNKGELPAGILKRPSNVLNNMVNKLISEPLGKEKALVSISEELEKRFKK